MVPHLGGLLVEDFQLIDRDWPQFRRNGGGYWADRNGEPGICLLDSLPEGLREQRMWLEQAPKHLQALLIADSQADPGVLANLRKVAQLLGIA
jgi:hypothetical protein